ncbi:MAG: cation:proton antiporter [Opitutaceae bacterium]|nr:cation:proton antiporter [Opitutaceae bacterium]
MHGIDFIKDLAVVMLVAGLVGWACHRIGLSVVVGFLVAGMVIGPYTPPFSLVSSAESIETLAQVGLIFLMFSIGMGLSLRKLRRLGLSLVLATFTGAIVMYNLTRVVGGGLGWSPVETAFLAAMLMVSSSAIISKVLQETGATHEKSGQMAMGVSVLEDVVAIVMLTILNSLVQIGGATASIGLTLSLLGAFIALAGIGGMLLVPWLLRKLSVTAGEELPTIVVAGLLFVMAFLADRAGFSLALGAFMLGAIVAETPHRTQVGRAFEGMRDVFSAVFFVSIGMLIDLRAVVDSWLLILGITVFVLVARPLAVAAGILLIGGSTRESLRVGLSVTPLGEFSFIIAQMGVVAGAVPSRFQALAVGVSLLTTLACPVLTRRSEAISGWLAARQPKWLADLEEYYHRWLERMQQRERKSKLWQLSKKRFIQVAVEMLFVTGLLVFSEQMFGLVRQYLPAEQSSFPRAAEILFWGTLVLVTLGPIIAIWRNISALALLFAQVTTAGHPKAAKMAPVVETGLKGAAGMLLLLWLSALLPISGMARWLPVMGMLLVLLAFILLRRRLVYWHSVLEVELQEMLAQGDQKFTGTTAPFMAPHGDWNLALADCALPDLADCRGRTLGELALRSRFGCTVAGVERQGVMVGNPTADMILYPRDKVLLLGDQAQVAAAKEFLQRVSGAPTSSNFDEVRMESVELPLGTLLHGRTLSELALSRNYGLQVAGINRGGARILNPGGDVKLFTGDKVLVLGSPDQIATFKAGIRGPEAPAGAGS